MSFYLLSTAILAATSVLAAPNVAARQNEFAIVATYNDGACSDYNYGGQAVYGQGALGCFSTNNAVGTQVKGSGCATYFYDVEDCSQGQLLVPDSGCYANVKAFAIDCS